MAPPIYMVVHLLILGRLKADIFTEREQLKLIALQQECSMQEKTGIIEQVDG